MRGQKKGPIINERIELERQKLIKKASQKPICMVIDTPDPHGKTHNTKYTSFFIILLFVQEMVVVLIQQTQPEDSLVKNEINF